MQGAGYSESKVEANTTGLELEDLVVPQEVLNQERSVAD
jgi:hypothetical protein